MVYLKQNKMIIYFIYFLLVITLCVYNNGKDKKEIFLQATLLFSSFVVFITESLSFFKSLNLVSIASFWAILSITLLHYLLKNRQQTLSIIKEYKFIYFKICLFY